MLDLAERGVVSGGTSRNHAWLNPTTDWGDLTQPEQLVLADAQTSGGLLIATRHADALRVALEARAVPFAEIGEIVPGTGRSGRRPIPGRGSPSRIAVPGSPTVRGRNNPAP